MKLNWPFFALVIGLLVALGFLNTGCNDEQLVGAPETIEPETSQSYTDIYQQGAGSGKVDVVWVVDNSGSMGQEQAKLADSFAAFIAYFETLELDYQMVIVTTDVDQPTHRGQFQGGVVLTPDTPNVAALFQQIVDVGTNGSINSEEQGMEGARLALVNNPTFLRQDALLSIIFVSDEDDQSFMSDTNPVECVGSGQDTSQCTPVADYVDFFNALKAREDQVHMGVIVGPTPNGCDNEFGRADTAPRYSAAASSFTTGIEETICRETFGPALDHLGDVISGLVRSSFPTSYAPKGGEVTVHLDNVEVAAGADTWTFDTDTNAVIFNSNFAPEECTEVSISYVIGDDTVLLETPGGLGPDASCGEDAIPGFDPPAPTSDGPRGGSLNGGAIAACSIGAPDSGSAPPFLAALLIAALLYARLRTREKSTPDNDAAAADDGVRV